MIRRVNCVLRIFNRMFRRFNAADFSNICMYMYTRFYVVDILPQD